MDTEDSKPPDMDDLDALANFDNMSALNGMDSMNAMDGMEAINGMESIDGMDDLFLDPGPSINLTTAGSVRGLPQRLEELQMTSCCQKIAWSRMGCIASISPNRRSVKIQGYALSFQSESATLDTSSVHGSSELVHLSWDRIGSNVAIIDALGRVSIFRTITCLNRMHMTGSFTPDQNDAFSAVVGMEWTTPVARQVSKICHSATWNKDTWSYNILQDSVKGPLHPVFGSHSLLLVTRGAALRLVFAMASPDAENGYAEINVPLIGEASVNSLITHASFASGSDGSALLATYDISQTLRIFRVAIDWNYPYTPGQKVPSDFKLEPSLKVTPLHILQGCAPDGFLDIANRPRLYHLHLFPSFQDSISGTTIRPEVLALFNVSNSITQVWRWEMHETREELQSCFQQLAPKKNKVTPTALETIHTLVQQKDVDIPCPVVAIAPFRLNTLIAFCRSDGGIELRERPSMAQPLTSPESGPIHSLAGAGFSFLQGEPCLGAAFSPNGCIAATHQHHDSENEELIFRYVEQQPEYSPLTIQAFAITFATTCFQNYNNDDLLETVRRTNQKNPLDIQKLLGEMFLCVRANESAMISDHRQLMSNLFLSRCLSMQLYLGPLAQSGDQSSNVAWLLLNMRLCVMSLHLAWEHAKRENYRAELPASVLGLVQWYTDTMIYLAGDLIHLHGKRNDPEAFAKHISSPGNLAVRLMLSSICRVFLRAINRYLRYVEHFTREVSQYPIRIVQTWSSLAYAVASSPVDVYKFEQMLAELDHYVKGTYEQAGTSEQERMACERTLLLSNSVPEVLMPVVERLASSTLSKLMDDMKDPARVVFADTSWLWTSRYPGAGKSAGGRPRPGAAFDAIRKVPLTKDTPLRRCTRCECVMENIDSRNAPATWILHMQKNCVCGCPWVLVGE